MKIEPSGISGIDLVGPGSAEFRQPFGTLLGHEPDETLRLAARFSVIARNLAARPVALFGVRFDMIGERGRSCSVVHYADTLRNPEKADFVPGAVRFVCAEPFYTELVLGRKLSGHAAERRARMNLDNLSKSRAIRASIDCVAFDDGRFYGPDSRGAFDRLARERESEMEFLERILRPGAEVENLLVRAIEEGAPVSGALARRLQESLQLGGPAEALHRARGHRPRIALSR